MTESALRARAPRPTTLSGGPASRDELSQRVESLPGALAQVLDAPLPALPDLSQIQRFDVTGIGASEGPARLLVSALTELGRSARFVPASSFLDPQSGTNAALLVFSQGLCPNARLALRQAGNYSVSLLFTAVLDEVTNGPVKAGLLEAFRESGGLVWAHPPVREGGSLVRLVGPACALLASLRLLAHCSEQSSFEAPTWLAQLEEIPAAVARSLAAPRSLLGTDPFALVGPGRLLELLPSLAWKWQEALFATLPHSFETLSFMHGPLQSLHERPATVLLCTNRSSSTERDLFERLGRVLEGERHRLVELESTLPGPLAWFELDAVFNRLVLLEMSARELEPGSWPAQGRDAPLYQLGE